MPRYIASVRDDRKNSGKGDRRHQSSLLTKMVGLLNNLVGIIIYIVMSLPISILWILLIIPRLSLKGISSIGSIGFYILQGIWLKRDSRVISRKEDTRMNHPNFPARKRGAKPTVGYWYLFSQESLSLKPNDELLEFRNRIPETRRRENLLRVQAVSSFDIFNRINTLRIPITREIEVMIMDCQKKWMDIEVSRERINIQRAKEATISLYAALGLSEPEIVFAGSPYKGLQIIIDLKMYLHDLQEGPLKTSIYRNLKADNIPMDGSRKWSRLLNDSNDNGGGWNIEKMRVEWIIAREISIKIIEKKMSKPQINSHSLEYKSLNHILNYQLENNCIMPSLWSDVGAWLDFQSNALKIIEPQKVSYHFGKIIQECGWIFPFKDICVICDRPLKINLDNQYRLHGLREPAVEYADGFRIYAHEGVILPEKYSKHPDKWRSQWIFEERNAELRRVLIQGIGYDRIVCELSSKTVDSWKEYTLLRLADNIDRREPTFLLKMTCPSTGHIHALRVPPHMRSAREAIRWVNGGIDPEEFSVET